MANFEGAGDSSGRGVKRPLSAAEALEAVQALPELDQSDEESDGNLSDDVLDDDSEWEGGDDDGSVGDGEPAEGDSDNEGDVEEEVDLGGGNVFRWGTVSHAPVSFNFTGTPGLAVPLVDPQSPLEIFQRFISDDILDMIVLETNRRAQQLASQRGIITISNNNFLQFFMTLKKFYSFLCINLVQLIFV
jgi:hypothetical protein